MKQLFIPVTSPRPHDLLDNIGTGLTNFFLIKFDYVTHFKYVTLHK